MPRNFQRWRVCVALGLGVLAMAGRVDAACLPGGPYRVLAFSKTVGFRHSSIPAALAAVQQLGIENNFLATGTESGAAFTDANLAQYQAVIFLLTTGDVLDPAQQAAFERYIRNGGGYVGIHSATDTEYEWPWYEELVGAYFDSHPAIQTATLHLEDDSHPSSGFLPLEWVREDEWYNFRTNPRAEVNVLLRLDESSYSGGNMGDHPIAWYHPFEGGRSWYTAGGHTTQSYSEPAFLAHLLGGIRYAAGRHHPAPAGALVLFDGRDRDQWVDSDGNAPVTWPSVRGVLEVAPGSGSIRTFQHFVDFQMHVEFRVPSSPPGTAEGALGNSGIFLQDRYEVQILDSYNRPVAGENESGAIWSIRDPDSNASHPPDTWEQFDIDFRAARWNGTTKTEDARVTVCWNGVVVQNDVPIPRPTSSGAPPEEPGPGPISLQDLAGAVQFRNIWVRPLNTPAPAAPADFEAQAGGSVIVLDWAASEGRTSYTVRRAISEAGPFRVLASGLGAPGYQDWDITNAVTYYYRVSAMTGGVMGPESAASATARGQTRVLLTLVEPGADWSYLDDGSDPGTEWKGPGYDDSGWRVGGAELGYGDGDEETEVRSNRGDGSRILSTYFRKRFEVTNAWAIDSLVLGLQRDDGAVVYLNGAEIVRSNMDPGTVTFMTTASATVGGNEESSFLTFAVPYGVLTNGSNLLAVEIHQVSGTSSDISFDLSLSGVAYGIPSLSMFRAGGLLLLSWPGTPPGFSLEATARLGAGLPWVELTGFPVSLSNNVKTVTMTHPFSSRYFRLKQDE